MSPIVIIVVIFVLLYLAVLLGAVWVSVHPFRTPLFLAPGSLEAPQEDIEFTNDQGTTLRGWWMHRENPRGVAILAHGYMMNRSEPTTVALHLWKRGYACMLFDFRAHGRSSGERTGFGVHERRDVEAAIAFAGTREPNAPILLWGSSMGCAAIAFAVAEQPERVRGIIFDSAYSQLISAVNGWWYFVGGRVLAGLLLPVPLISRLFVPINPWKVDVAEAVAKIQVPMLFVHGDSDTLALPDQARRNVAAAGDRGQIEWFQGCNHSEARWVYPARYEGLLDKFCDQIERD